MFRYHQIMKTLILFICAFTIISLSPEAPCAEQMYHGNKRTSFPAEYTDPSTGMKFVFIKGGCYEMGDVFGDGNESERPVHRVCVNDYYIGKFEVTQSEWKAVMGTNPSKFKLCGTDCPVENVSWNDVNEFMRNLNAKSGKKIRLPTEAEWEYAARDRGKKEKYAGSNEESALGVYAWYLINSGGKTQPVGRKKPNALGIYDMTGNVMEWVSDWYSIDYYRLSPKENPEGPAAGTFRVYRGGGWNNGPKSMSTTFRKIGAIPSYSLENLGFRLAITP